MEKNLNDQHTQYKAEKKSNFFSAMALIIMTLMISSCSAIGEIFKAGMSFGIFIVVAIIVVIIIIALRFGNKKS